MPSIVGRSGRTGGGAYSHPPLIRPLDTFSRRGEGVQSTFPSGAGQPVPLRLAYLSSSVTIANSSGSAVVYLICPMAKDELTSLRLILAISFL